MKKIQGFFALLFIILLCTSCQNDNTSDYGDENQSSWTEENSLKSGTPPPENFNFVTNKEAWEE